MRVRANLAVGLLAMWMYDGGGGAGTAVAQQPVDLELVLAIDISGSVDEEEAALQREGYVLALNNPRVIAAMGGGPFGAIAVTYVEWAGEDYQRTVVPWTLIGNRGTGGAVYRPDPGVAFRLGALDVAERRHRLFRDAVRRQRVRRCPAGDRHLGRRGKQPGTPAGAGARSGGGRRHHHQRAAHPERPAEPWGGAAPIDLDRYYEENVIGGPGAFYIAARDFDDFSAAILSKLIREIAGLRDGAGLS